MSRRPTALLLFSCVLLAACDASTPPVATPASPSAVPPLGMGRGDRLEWRARLDCADCDAIRTELQLLRDGDARDYVLTEVYLAAAGNARFQEQGQWRQHDAWLRLQAADGSSRLYALLPDGRLQSLDRHGHALSQRDQDLLLPVTPGTRP